MWQGFFSLGNLKRSLAHGSVRLAGRLTNFGKVTRNIIDHAPGAGDSRIREGCFVENKQELHFLTDSFD